jgi:hypothetical protein
MGTVPCRVHVHVMWVLIHQIVLPVMLVILAIQIVTVCSQNYTNFQLFCLIILCFLAVTLLPPMPTALSGLGTLFNLTVEWQDSNPSSVSNYTLEWNVNGNWEIVYLFNIYVVG